jgi:hypothetical protein
VIRRGAASPDLNLALYKQIGGDWHWRDRLVWSEQRWTQYLNRPEVQTWMMYEGGAAVVFRALGFGLALGLGLALVRRLPTSVLAPIAIGIMALHMRLDLGGLPDGLRWILHEPHYKHGEKFKVLYPIIPWLGIMLFGFIADRHSTDPTRVTVEQVDATVVRSFLVHIEEDR